MFSHVTENVEQGTLCKPSMWVNIWIARIVYMLLSTYWPYPGNLLEMGKY